MANIELWENTSDALGPQLRGIQSKAVMACVIGAVLVLLGVVYHPVEDVVRGLGHAYLTGYLFWFGVTVGSLGLLMLHHTVGGGWGFIIRRQIEAGSRLLPLTALLFLPLVLFMWFGHIYPWTDPDVAAEPSVRWKAPFLNPYSYVIISAVLFAIWMIYSGMLNRWGAEQDREASEQATIDNSARLTVGGASGLVVYVLSMTFMAVLWVMSLTPTWVSSIFGFLVVVSQGLSTLALMMWLFPKMVGNRPIAGAIPQKYFRDLGNLMLAFTMLWAYMSFSQYLITFSGNTAEEVVWYIPRTYTGWFWISMVIIAFHFFFPFFWLIIGALGGRRWKDQFYRLSWIAGYIVFIRFIDLWWWVAPSFRPHLSINPAEVGFPLLLGGVWIWFWAAQMTKSPTLAPKYDPRLQAGLYEVAEHA